MIQKTLDDHIESTPDVCGGQPRIAGHRITVRQVAVWHDRMGMSADEIAAEYNLAVADIYAALAYYFDHREQIDVAATEDDRLVDDLKLSIPSKLKPKLSGEKDR